jgi:septum formation protein
MLFNNKFILASTSSSRFKILKNNKLSFSKIEPMCNEDYLKKKMILKKIPHKKISLELARLKSGSVCKKIKDTLVLGSDTVISFQGEILNKAKNLKEAKKTILSFSGKTHNIYSSASVFFNNKEVWNSTQKSVIKIRKIDEQDVDTYLKKTGNKILSSVGCYQAESLGPNLIESIEGDFFNVLGLPLFPFLLFLSGYNKNKK